MIDMQNGAILSDRALLHLAGAEAKGWLQGLVTNDLDALSPARPVYAALLTPQGKILFDFLVLEQGDGTLLLDCAASARADLIKRLRLYRLRSKVEISEANLGVAALWGEGFTALPSGAIVVSDPRLPALGTRVVAPHLSLFEFVPRDGLNAYHAHRIALGVPDSSDLHPNTVFALDAGFEELNGVNFRKGCYVGQEVTARMKHKSPARKRFMIVRGNVPHPFDAALEAGGKEIGTMSVMFGNEGLALIRLDRLEEAGQMGLPLTIAGTPVTLTKPFWLEI